MFSVNSFSVIFILLKLLRLHTSFSFYLIERFQIVFTANGKREMEKWKNEYIDENSAKKFRPLMQTQNFSILLRN